MRLRTSLLGSLLLIVMLAACASGSSLLVTIIQERTTCQPDTIAVRPKEHVTFKLVNQSGQDAAFAGTPGTALSQTVVPPGASRNVTWHAPNRPEIVRFTCSRPDSTPAIVTVQVG